MTTQPTARQRLIDAMQADTCFCGADSCQTAEEYVDAFARELAAASPAADRAATPAAWSDDDPLMWAIARAVWQQCAPDEEGQRVWDDPRNIAAAAAAAVRAQAPAADRCTCRQAIHTTHHTTPVPGCPWCATKATKAKVDPPATCEGFVWIGQPFTSCDRCGQPAWDHAGQDVAVEGAGPFDTGRTVQPWAPGEADAIRAKWGPQDGARP